MNAKFEAMTPEELAGEFYKLENPTKPEPVLFYEETGINGYLDESNKLVSKVKNTLAEADSKISAIDKQLRADIVAERADAIRKSINDRVEAWVQQIREHAEMAASQERFYSPRVCMMRAAFDYKDDAKDATIRLSYSHRLAKLNTVSLKAFAELASADSNLALACCISEEMEAREDLLEQDSRKPNRGTREEIDALLASVPNPSGRVLNTLHKIKMNAEEVKAITSRSYSSINRIALGLQQAM